MNLFLLVWSWFIGEFCGAPWGRMGVPCMRTKHHWGRHKFYNLGEQGWTDDEAAEWLKTCTEYQATLDAAITVPWGEEDERRMLAATLDLQQRLHRIAMAAEDGAK